MFHEFDVVKLKKAIPSKKLEAGTHGTILLIYMRANSPNNYEVEFVDSQGNTLSIATVEEEDIELLLV